MKNSANVGTAGFEGMQVPDLRAAIPPAAAEVAELKTSSVLETASQGSPLRVLFFEDCLGDIDLCVRVLLAAGFEVKWDMAVTRSEFCERVRTVAYDIILSDYRMPQATGMEVFELMKADGIQTPFILVTGSLGDEKAIECLKQGMADYVLKDRLARLPIAIRRARKEDRLRAERAQAEAALRASEASYRSLVQSAPCGILRLSAGDGHLLDANTAFAGMLGYESPLDLFKSVSGGNIGLDMATLSHAMAAGAGSPVVACEIPLKRKDGARLVVKLAGRLVCDSGGSPACLDMIAENVTARCLAQKRIEQLNRLYSVLTHANQAIVRIRENGALFEEICRLIVEEGDFQMAWFGLLEPDGGLVIPSAIHPMDDRYLEGCSIVPGHETAGSGPAATAIWENRQVVWNDLFGESAPALWKGRALERSFLSVAAFPVVSHGRAIGALSIYSAEKDFFDAENVALLTQLAADVSFAMESIAADQMHQRVAAELDQFFALSLDMLCIQDLDGYMQRFNPAWERALGYTKEEIRARPWSEFVHPDDRRLVVNAQQRLRAGAEVRQLELRLLAKDGSCKWLVGCAVPALERGVVFAAMSDITELKQLEERLRSQNLILEERNRRIEAASRMKTEFLANMSHELRSPLNGVIGFSELLYDGKLGELAARPREYVGRIHASAAHLLQLLNGVLDLSKIEAGHLEFCPERLRVSHVVQEVAGILDSLAAGKQIRVESKIDAAVDEVTIDAGRLRQVLYNYLSNALKFTAESGRVTVRVKAEGAGDFRLEISDTGIGVSAEDIPRLFVEFQQLDATTAKRYQGTGLGLALTKRIVEAQGGRVGVDSSAGRGSTFWAVLPRAPRSIGPDGVIRILVVDDRELDRFLLSHILALKGYVVETAATGEEAYEKCRHQQFDAITLDLVLADGFGWELLPRIRALEGRAYTPVIVISAVERADLEIPVSVEGFLMKPVHSEELLGVLKRLHLPAKEGVAANV